MGRLKNRKYLTRRRIELRKNMTKEEVVLWSLLRRKNFGPKFRRQFSIGNYILDFYCPELRLAIEIDGSQHVDSKKDAMRDKFLREQGIEVLRFWNVDVNNNIDGVVQMIMEKVLDLRSI